jgi:hypothetical protein
MTTASMHPSLQSGFFKLVSSLSKLTDPKLVSLERGNANDPVPVSWDPEFGAKIEKTVVTTSSAMRVGSSMMTVFVAIVALLFSL